MRLGGLSFVFVSTLASCSATFTGSPNNGDGGTTAAERQKLDAPSLCDRIINECKDKSATLDDCTQLYAAVRVTKECLDLVPNATCDDLTKPDTPGAKICFPSCAAGTDPVCNPDATITFCAEGRTFVIDCATLCRQSNQTYSGTCATTYKGQTSKTGKNVCFCE